MSDNDFDLDIRISVSQGTGEDPEFCGVTAPNNQTCYSCYTVCGQDTCFDTCFTCVNTCGDTCYTCTTCNVACGGTTHC
jgi:hypothetical protein